MHSLPPSAFSLPPLLYFPHLPSCSPRLSAISSRYLIYFRQSRLDSHYQYWTSKNHKTWRPHKVVQSLITTPKKVPFLISHKTGGKARYFCSLLGKKKKKKCLICASLPCERSTWTTGSLFFVGHIYIKKRLSWHTGNEKESGYFSLVFFKAV